MVGGAKAYGMIWKNKKTGEREVKLKIRGITLDHNAREEITFEKLKTMVLGRRQESVNLTRRTLTEEKAPSELIVERINFKRTYHTVESVVAQKKYRLVNNKSLDETDDGTVYPFGYHLL